MLWDSSCSQIQTVNADIQCHLQTAKDSSCHGWVEVHADSYNLCTLAAFSLKPAADLCCQFWIQLTTESGYKWTQVYYIVQLSKNLHWLYTKSVHNFKLSTKFQLSIPLTQPAYILLESTDSPAHVSKMLTNLNFLSKQVGHQAGKRLRQID